MGFLAFILKIFDPISAIADKIADYKIKQLNATTDREKIAAGERVDALNAKRDVMIAEAGSGVNTWMRAAIAAPFMLYLWKLIVWDKIIMGGQVATDNLSDKLWDVGMLVFGFYFLQSTVSTAVKLLRR